MIKIQPVILAGGSGSRLWPVSREIYPKQLLLLTGNKSLLQTTLDRVAKLGHSYPPIIVVCEEHRFVTKQQIEEMEIFKKYSILLEPLGRNTGPAICGTTEYVRRKRGEETVMLVLPSDHLIGREEEFFGAVEKAAALAASGRIVTFGVQPRRPETGYGYIEGGADGAVLSFREKPGIELAREYLAKGNWYWNSGMFAFSVRTFQQEMAKHGPQMQECMVAAIENGRKDGGFFRFDSESMGDVENTSIDYTLMEKTECASVVPVDLDWRDVGSWQSLWELMEKDEEGNVHWGDVILESTRNCLVASTDKLVAAIGLEDTVVVETADAILVSSMSAVQQVKKIVEYLKERDRDEFRFHKTVFRQWGSCTLLEAQQRYKISRVVVNPGAGLALQKHYHRFEHWVVVSGTAKITNGKDVFLLEENRSTYVPIGVLHRLENPGTIPLELIEVQIGDYLGDDDVVSYEAEYGVDSKTDEHS